MVWSMALLIKAGIDTTPRTLSASLRSWSFQLSPPHMLFSVPAAGFVVLLLSHQNDKSTVSKQTFLLGPPSPPYGKLFCWPCMENGIQVNGEAWDNWNAFFICLLPFLHLQITFVPLTLYMCLMFHPLLRLTYAHSYWLFSIPPLQPSSLLTLSL